MAELKTKRTKASVDKYLLSVEDEGKRKDSQQLLKIFEEVTGEKACLWGDGMIGFGSYHYKSERSTQEGDWPLTAFAPRKQNITIYIMSGFGDNQDLLGKIGKHKISKGSCLYVKKLSDIEIPVLKKLIKKSVAFMRKNYT